VQRILVVDDATEAAEPLRRMLERYGFEVEMAGDGLAGLAELERFKPDAVILDLHMPVLDGYGFLERMRQRDLGAGCSVIVFTADYEGDFVRLESLGATVRRKAYTSFQTLVHDLTDCLHPADGA
jgi:DNA-binding response OmpR family regulator